MAWPLLYCMYCARWPAILRKKSLSKCQLWMVRCVPQMRCLCAALPTSCVANRLTGLSNMPKALPNTKSPMMSKTNHSHQCAAFHASFQPPSFSSAKPFSADQLLLLRPSSSQPTRTLARMYFSKLLIAESLNAWLMTRLLRACCILSTALCTLTAFGVLGNAW